MAAANNSNSTNSGGNTPVPVPPLSNPFFTVPDLSPDGDFEVLGVNVHHTLVPPPNAFFTLPDLGAGESGMFSPNPSNPYGSLPDPTADGDYNNFHVDGTHDDGATLKGDGYDGPSGIKSGGGDPTGGGPSGQTDNDLDGDHSGDQPWGVDNHPIGDSDNGAGGDNYGQNNDGTPGDYSDSDNGAGRDYSQGHHIDGRDQSDSDNGGGEDKGIYNPTIGGYVNADGTDVTIIATQDSDQSNPINARTDPSSTDTGDTIPLIDGDQLSHGGTDALPNNTTDFGDTPSYSSDFDKDQADASNNYHRSDPGFDHIGIKVDADSFTCDSSALYAQYPPPAGGQAAAALLIAAMGLLEAIPTILFLPWFGEAMAESMFSQAMSGLSAILKVLGAGEIASIIIDSFIGQYGTTSPLNLLNAGNRAASALQPALTNIENQNTLSSLKAFYAQNKCIPANCLHSYASIMAMDGVPFNICSDGPGGTDTGDHQSVIGGGGPGGGVGQTRSSNLIPVSSLAIPNLIPFGNSSSFSLNPFPNPSAANTSGLSPRKS